jgi:nitrite reductase (NO-forming)
MSALDASARPQQSPTAFGGLVRRVRANGRAKDAFRIGFAMIWLIDAFLKWEPAFRSGFTNDLKMAAQGQPGWLHGWFHFWIKIVAPNSGLFSYSTAVIETLVALAVLVGFARKFTYISAALFCVLIWATAEGFGGPYTSSSTDIGTAVIYAVVFMGLLALDYETGPSRFTVDSLIERRVSWWHRIAEIGPRQSAEKPPSALGSAEHAPTPRSNNKVRQPAPSLTAIEHGGQGGPRSA